MNYILNRKATVILLTAGLIKRHRQRERTMNYILNRKATVILLTAGLIKRHRQLYKMSYFPEPHIQSKCKIEVELDLSKYAIKSDFKNEAGVDT